MKLKDLKVGECFKPYYYTKLCPLYKRLRKYNEEIKVEDLSTNKIYYMGEDLEVYARKELLESKPIPMW